MLPTSWLGEKLGEAAVQLVARKQINPYGYVPTFGVCILFIVVFALSGGKHEFWIPPYVNSDEMNRFLSHYDLQSSTWDREFILEISL